MLLAACSNGAAKQEEGPTVSIPHEASVTVYPVDLAGQPRVEVARVVASMLERGGMQRVEVSERAWSADASQSLDPWANEVAASVKAKSPASDYVLVGAYVGSPKRGVDEVRSVLVNANGEVVWSDCQKKGDRDFDRIRPSNPMTCTVLMVERLKRPMALDDPFRKGAPRSRHERAMDADAGVASEAELAAMRKRAAALSKDARPSLVVYPVRVGDTYSSTESASLSRALEALGQVSASKDVRKFAFTGSMNQQKVLWSAARAIQADLKKSPVKADYVLFAHYVKTPMKEEPFAVHTFLFTGAGEFVVVDYQNSHKADFNTIDPRTPAACTQLAVLRVQRHWGG